MELKETILGQCVAKANHYMSVPAANGERRIIKDDAIRDYERSFARQCFKYKDKRIDELFTLNITVYHSSKRYDLDNSLKTVLDCLQYCNAITDDKNCIEINAKKKIDKRNPRVEFEIIPMVRNLFDYDIE